METKDLSKAIEGMTAEEFTKLQEAMKAKEAEIAAEEAARTEKEKVATWVADLCEGFYDDNDNIRFEDITSVSDYIIGALKELNPKKVRGNRKSPKYDKTFKEFIFEQKFPIDRKELIKKMEVYFTESNTNNLSWAVTTQIKNGAIAKDDNDQLTVVAKK